MFKTLTLIVTTLAVGMLPVVASRAAAGQQPSYKTTAIDALPFCAIALRVFVYENARRVRVYILMEPDKITESNLRMLFDKISHQYHSAAILEATVNTDVEQLGFLATRQAHSGVPNFEIKEKRSAYYSRNERVESFTYIPNHEGGELKTVIIRGKE